MELVKLHLAYYSENTPGSTSFIYRGDSVYG